jgi:2-polyprenyl-3-methyl-5-hydroxy-6-metoxy-1,4-benzoquinol methylase
MQEIIDYWNKRPCNIRHSTKEFKTKEYFDEVEDRKYFVESHIPDFANFPMWKNKKVLEIGCGIGTDATNFAKNGAEYVGVELSDESLNIAKERFKVYGLEKGTSFYNLDAQNFEELSVVGKDFDLIYSFGVIHHSPNPQRILENCYKLLKPGGTLKIMVYAENSWKKYMIDCGLDQYEAQSKCPVAFTYTKEEITNILENAQFTNIDILQTHIFPFKVEKYIKYEYEFEDWFRSMPKEMFSMLESKLGWHLCVTCKHF